MYTLYLGTQNNGKNQHVSELKLRILVLPKLCTATTYPDHLPVNPAWYINIVWCFIALKKHCTLTLTALKLSYHHMQLEMQILTENITSRMLQ